VDLLKKLTVQYDNVHRGQSVASLMTTAKFEASYDTIAQFIGAPSRRNIILYRTSLLRSHKKPTEFVFPIIYPNELEYSLVGQLEPVKKSEKPRIT
jgi:hypothetical protein